MEILRNCEEKICAMYLKSGYFWKITKNIRKFIGNSKYWKKTNKIGKFWKNIPN